MAEAMTSAIRNAVDVLMPAAQSINTENLTFATSTDTSLRVMKAVDNPDLNMDDLVRIVSAEPLLSAKVIHLANSVALNPTGQPVSDLRQAVARVGLAPVRTLAMALTLDQMRHSQSLAACRELANRLWERSVHVAALAYVVARRMANLSADEAMLAGIVHDLGRFYLLGIAAEEHPELLEDQPALVAALDLLDTIAGRRLLEVLGLPEHIVAAVAGRHDFGRALPPRSLSEVLFVACWLAPPENPFEDAEERQQRRVEESVALGLDHQTIDDFVSASGAEIYSIALALEA